MTPCEVLFVGTNRWASTPILNALRAAGLVLQVVYRLSLVSSACRRVFDVVAIMDEHSVRGGIGRLNTWKPPYCSSGSLRWSAVLAGGSSRLTRGCAFEHNTLDKPVYRDHVVLGGTRAGWDEKPGSTKCHKSTECGLPLNYSYRT